MASSEDKTKKKTAKKKAAAKSTLIKASAKKSPVKKAPAKKTAAKKASRKKTRKIKEILISESQKKFIEDKVKSLGTIEKVRSFYSLDDNVCKYAVKKAEEIYGV